MSNLDISRNTVIALLHSKNIERIHRLGMVGILPPAELLKIVLDKGQRLSKLEIIKVASTKGLNLEEAKKHLPNLQIVESRHVRESPEHI